MGLGGMPVEVESREALLRLREEVVVLSCRPSARSAKGSVVAPGPVSGGASDSMRSRSLSATSASSRAAKGRGAPDERAPHRELDEPADSARSPRSSASRSRGAINSIVSLPDERRSLPLELPARVVSLALVRDGADEKVAWVAHARCGQVLGDRGGHPVGLADDGVPLAERLAELEQERDGVHAVVRRQAQCDLPVRAGETACVLEAPDGRGGGNAVLVDLADAVGIVDRSGTSSSRRSLHVCGLVEAKPLEGRVAARANAYERRSGSPIASASTPISSRTDSVAPPGLDEGTGEQRLDADGVGVARELERALAHSSIWPGLGAPPTCRSGSRSGTRGPYVRRTSRGR